MAKLVSVIIPAYNIELYIEKCLRSILHQTHSNLEIIVINDGSTDRTATICEKVAKTDNRIIFVNQDNKGVSVARNTGLEKATGELISFIDGDDYIDSDMYENLVNIYMNYPSCSLAVCSFYKDSIEIKNPYKDKLSEFNKVETVREMLNPYGFRGYLWNKLFKSEIVKSNRIRFNEAISYCEDALFCHEYAKHIEKTFFINKAGYHYVTRRMGSATETFNKKRLSVIDAYEKIMKIVDLHCDNEIGRLARNNYIVHCLQNIKMISHANVPEKRYHIKLLLDKIREIGWGWFWDPRFRMKYKLLYLYILFSCFFE